MAWQVSLTRASRASRSLTWITVSPACNRIGPTHAGITMLDSPTSAAIGEKKPPALDISSLESESWGLLRLRVAAEALQGHMWLTVPVASSPM